MSLRGYHEVSVQSLTRGSEVAPVTRTQDTYKYVDGRKTEKREGTAYHISLPEGESLVVKIEDSIAELTQEDINKAYASGNLLMVGFSDLELRPYVDKMGRLQFSARAKAIIVSNKEDR